MIKKISLIAAVLLFGMPFVFALSSSTETQFSMGFAKPYCQYIGIVGWWEISGGLFYFTPYTDASYNCHRNIVEYGMTDCCPGGMTCTSGKCVERPEDPTTCEELTQSQCSENAGHVDFASRELEGVTPKSCGYDANIPGSTCSEKVNCLCSWNGTSCLPTANYTITNNRTVYSFPFPANIDSICNGHVTGGYCFYDTSVVDDCDTNNRKLVSWTAQWRGTGTPTEKCEGDSKSMACISGTLLDFFNLINLLVAVLIIVIFYLVVSYKKKKHAKKKRK